MTVAQSNFASATLPLPGNLNEARHRISEMLRRIESYSDKAVWIHRLTQPQINSQLDLAARRLAAGTAQPLFGLTFAIKDNIDLAGAPTTAACPEFAYTPCESASVVQRLCDAGAIALGKTNLDQFATGLVGTRSPYGAVRNPFNNSYISGGSSSGSAVAVTAGLVDFSLGTDTAGSGRVPAAFCNLVGLKPTPGLLSTTGVVPACRSLDCVSIFTRTVDQAAQVLAIARGFDDRDIYSRRVAQIVPTEAGQQFRFGVPSDAHREFFGNEDAEWLYHHSIQQAMSLGGLPVEIDYAPFLETARLLYEGPWLAERYLACKDILERNSNALLPITRSIISRGANFTAADAFNAQYKLRALRSRAEKEWSKMDTLLLPTTGTIYTLAEVEAEPIQLNTNLGYYTNFANLLDLSAIAVPNDFDRNRLPSGVTFFAPAGTDDWLIGVARRFESINNSRGAA
jgi:allophanate hydrolase